MSEKVTVKVRVAMGHDGRKRLALAPETSVKTPEQPERVPRVARLLALAHHWNGLLRAGTVRGRADLARLVGVSRARVTQVHAPSRPRAGHPGGGAGRSRWTGRERSWPCGLLHRSGRGMSSGNTGAGASDAKRLRVVPATLPRQCAQRW